MLIFRDVTEKRQDEEALRQSERCLRFVMDSMPQKIFTATPNGDVDYFNPQWTEFTGLPFETIRDWGWTQFIHPDDLAENVRVWRQAIDSGELFLFEHRFRRADGEDRWHISRALPMRDDAGKVLMWVGSNTDIDEQKQTANEMRKLAAELSEADRRKDEFLAMLAHELRNPLAPIRNAAEILRVKGPAAPELQWAREVMDRQVQQMTRLVDDLLDVSRITRGKIELRKERVELVAVVKSAVEASRPLIEKWGHDLTVTVPPEPIHLEADLIRLSQVLLNLLNNAAKYTDQGGRIWLTAERQGDQVLIRVKDTGIGISAEMLPRIFEMFTQVDRTLERSQGGLGIGLMLVQRLVEMPGGTVEAHSTGPGKGSEFVLRFPVAVEVKRKPQEEAGHGQDTVPSTCRILVVDDNEDSAESIAILLRTMGNEVHTANDGLEAVGAAAAFQPDVVLLDIGLPKLNGFDAARRIREQSGGSDIVLIALRNLCKSPRSDR